MLTIPPFGASSNIALWRANIKPPVELVVADLGNNPMVGATVAVAVSVEEAAKAGKF